MGYWRTTITTTWDDDMEWSQLTEKEEKFEWNSHSAISIAIEKGLREKKNYLEQIENIWQQEK